MKKAIILAQSFSIVHGNGDTLFSPGTPLTRAEAAKILSRAFLRE